METTQINASSVHDFSVQTIDGNEVSLSQYKGKVLLIVNVASECGFTPQYEDLQAFYEEYASQGVEVLGFPANNFGGQEPGSNEEIKAFCTSRFSVSFPMFAKISVVGADQHPLYEYLSAAAEQEPKWNFHKYLVDQEGKVVAVYGSRTNPYDEALINDVKGLL